MNLTSIKAKWEVLNIREQRLVLLMSSAILIFLLYSLVWLPLNENLAKTKQRLLSRQALLTWVTNNTDRYQSIKSSGGHSENKASLSSIVNRTASQQQLIITRLQPQGENIQVWIDSASFNQLLFWLEQLTNTEGLQVQTIDLTQGDNSGEVRVRRLQLTRQ